MMVNLDTCLSADLTHHGDHRNLCIISQAESKIKSTNEEVGYGVYAIFFHDLSGQVEGDVVSTVPGHFPFPTSRWSYDPISTAGQLRFELKPQILPWVTTVTPGALSIRNK